MSIEDPNQDSNESDTELVRDILVNRKTLKEKAQQLGTTSSEVRRRLDNFCQIKNAEAFKRLRKGGLPWLRQHSDQFIPLEPGERRAHPFETLAVEILIDGKTIREVAERHGLHPSGVEQKLKQFCLDANVEAYNRIKSWKLSEVREHSDLFLPNHKPNRPGDLNQTLAIEVLAKGKSFKEAAAQYGIPIHTCRERVISACYKANPKAFHAMNGWNLRLARENCERFTLLRPIPTRSKKLATAVLIKGESYEGAGRDYDLSAHRTMELVKEFCRETNPDALRSEKRWNLSWARAHYELFLPKKRTRRKPTADSRIEPMVRDVLENGKSLADLAQEHSIGVQKARNAVKRFCLQKKALGPKERWTLAWARKHRDIILS